MNSLRIIYKETIRKSLKSPTLWIITSLVLIVSILSCIGLPIYRTLLNKTQTFSSFYRSSDWNVLINQLTFVVLAFVGSIIGNMCAIHAELTYFLSKPIKRKTFILAKFLACATLSLLISLVNILFIFIIGLYMLIKKDGFNMFEYKSIHDKHKINFFSLLLISYLAIIIVSSTLSMMIRYNIRTELGVVFIILLYVIYVAIYPSRESTTNEEYDYYRVIWWTICPALISSALFFLFVPIFCILFKRKVIKS